VVKFGAGIDLDCRCIRCGAARAMPPTDRSRMPTQDDDGGTMVSTDEACGCGSTRVRIKLKFE
jgi:hypothetical protein